MIQSILTATQVNRFVKSLIDGDGRLKDFYMTGEISNFTGHYASGHLYFSLKDSQSLVKAIMFAGHAGKLKFLPKNGMKVIVRGGISVYEPSGQYQIQVVTMQPDGVGALSVAFEQLKEKLSKEGLFDEARKKPIPMYPKRIAVITSPTGAAVQDILQITGRRWPLAQIVLCPVSVQGTSAPDELTAALREVNETRAADVIIIGRGGGALEDLQGFNAEAVARAVAESEIPVVSAVGHETDFSICDFAADLRAATPSAAAELCTPDRSAELDRLNRLWESLLEAAGQTIENRRMALDHLLSESFLTQAPRFTASRRAVVTDLFEKLSAEMKIHLGDWHHQQERLTQTLDALSPLKVLQRGYAVCQDEEGQVVQSVTQVKSQDLLRVRLKDGTVKVKAL